MNDVAFPEWNNWVADFLAHFPIYVQHDRSRFTSIHKQPGAEIHIVCEGEANLFIGSRVLPQRPGRVAVFGGSTPHQLISDDARPFSRTVVCVDFGKLQPWELDGEPHPFGVYRQWTRSPTQFTLTEAEFGELERVGAALVRELYDKKLGWQHMLQARLVELTTLLQRSAERPGKGAAGGAPAKLSDLTVAGARYVQEHLADDLTLTGMAERLGVSPEHLTRTFQRDLRVSFYRYVLLLRVEEAKRLLWGRTDLSVAEVAEAVGFGSLSHFSATFQKLTEQTPSGFRRHKGWL